MKKLPIIDLLSLILIVVIGADVYRLHQRLNRMETVAAGGDAIESESLLPMEAFDAAGNRMRIERGEPRLVFLLSPHCPYCIKNMPIWTAVAKQVGPNHVLFLTAGNQAMRELPAFLAKFGAASFPSAAADPDVVNRYALTSVPRTFLVARNGTVTKAWRGAVTEKLMLDAWKSL